MVEQERHLDDLFMALADPTRRAIVARLATGSATVGEIAEPFGISLAAVSKHIQVLDRAGLINRDRQGRRIVCSLNPVELKTMSDWVSDCAAFWNERLTQLERVIKERKRGIR